MKRRIFGSMCLLAIVAVLICCALISWVMYLQLYDHMKQEIKKEAAYFASALSHSGDSLLETIQWPPDANRITLIATDGTVLFDNQYPLNRLGNHLNRPEVAEALQEGIGEATHLSSAGNEQTYYYAVRLENASVLRVAGTLDSVLASVLQCIPYVLLIVIGVLAAAFFLADRQTRRIMRSINSLDLEHPAENDTYDELSPLLSRIAKQNRLINAHIDALQKHQREFDAVTGNMKEGLVLLSADGKILSINHSAMQLFGAKDGDYIGKHIYTLNRSLELHRLIQDAEQGRAGDILLSQNQISCQLFANPVFNNGLISGIALLVLNVTEKQAAEQIRKEFSANVSHELKTPLQSISGYAEIMKNGLVKQEDVPRFAQRIYAESQQLIALVDDIIKLSRLDENHVSPPREMVDLFPLSQQVAERLLPQAAQRDVTLSVNGVPAMVSGTKQLLEEMLYNLLDNAIKYNRENGRVDITVATDQKQAVLTVADTGIGIPAAHRKRVFERFYRVDQSHSKATGGTGLGLSIVKHGANYHNAKMSLTSEEGKGTAIKLVFPLA